MKVKEACWHGDVAQAEANPEGWQHKSQRVQNVEGLLTVMKSWLRREALQLVQKYTNLRPSEE